MSWFDDAFEAVEEAYDSLAPTEPGFLERAADFIKGAATEAQGAIDSAAEADPTGLIKLARDNPPPGSLGDTTPEERDATEEVMRELPGRVKEKVSEGFTLLTWLTKPWVLVGLAVVITAAVAGPYVTPWLKRS